MFGGFVIRWGVRLIEMLVDLLREFYFVCDGVKLYDGCWSVFVLVWVVLVNVLI